MFLVSLTYTKPLESVDAHLAEHREFLERHYAAGNFLLSGRKEPREGGVILANVSSVEAIHAILEEDPFRINGIAEYELTRFTPTMSAPALETFIST